MHRQEIERTTDHLHVGPAPVAFRDHAPHDTGRLKDAEVMGHEIWRHLEASRKVLWRDVAELQLINNGQARWVPKRRVHARTSNQIRAASEDVSFNIH